MQSQHLYQQVQDHYGSVARSKEPTYSRSIAQAFGYTKDELNSIPKGANLGVSCGNPLAIASVREGETIIDLGSGAGFDIFLAANKVGPTGRAIGVDMNKDMLARARNNLSKVGKADNISFVEANITAIPMDDGIADCIISNCVINLVPECDKPAVFAEVGRLVKPGGRVAISDILERKPLPVRLRESIALYVGCVAGCSKMDVYERLLKQNGFHDITIIDAESDLNVYFAKSKEGQNMDEINSGCCAPAADKDSLAEAETVTSSKESMKALTCCSTTPKVSAAGYRDSGSTVTDVEKGLAANSAMRFAEEVKLADIDINEWAGSFKIFAVKA